MSDHRPNPIFDNPFQNEAQAKQLDEAVEKFHREARHRGQQLQMDAPIPPVVNPQPVPTDEVCSVFPGKFPLDIELSLKFALAQLTLRNLSGNQVRRILDYCASELPFIEGGYAPAAAPAFVPSAAQPAFRQQQQQQPPQQQQSQFSNPVQAPQNRLSGSEQQAGAPSQDRENIQQRNDDSSEAEERSSRAEEELSSAVLRLKGIYQSLYD